MFVGYKPPRVTWRDRDRIDSSIINPLSLPKVMNMGFGEFEGIFDFILGIFKTYKAKKKAREARKEAAAKWAAEKAAVEKALKEREEFLKRKWEIEITSRKESSELEALRQEEYRPPIYTWEDLSLRNATGSALISMSK